MSSDTAPARANSAARPATTQQAAVPRPAAAGPGGRYTGNRQRPPKRLPRARPALWSARLAAFGHWLGRHRHAIGFLQWIIVGLYALLLLVPAVLPLPDEQAHILTNLTVFAAFVFWGVWWPFVLISMVLFGRLWCGMMCPEGSLSELATHIGREGRIPRWVRWRGWPFVAFLGTTLYGQMASVYAYPTGALVVLGGSTLAAMVIGFLYGRKGSRVWCRHLCPVSGVFALLAKLAPLSFRTDPVAWSQFERGSGGSARTWRGERMPMCPPLVQLKQLQSTSPCHMCARCSGFRDAIFLTARAPGSEVVAESAERATVWEYLLLVFGVIGVAVGAFHWTASPWYVALKQGVALWLIEHGGTWILDTTLPWWILTNYPAQNDVFNLLDGVLLVCYIFATGLVLGGAISLALAGASRALGRWSWQRLWHLSHALIPVAGTGVFLGLSATTVSLLRGDGHAIAWANDLRATLLALASAWTLALAWRIGVHYSRSRIRHALMLGGIGLALAANGWAWWLMFWGW